MSKPAPSVCLNDILKVVAKLPSNPRSEQALLDAMRANLKRMLP